MKLEIFFPHLPPHSSASSLRGAAFIDAIINSDLSFKKINVYSSEKKIFFQNEKIKHYSVSLFSQDNTLNLFLRAISDLLLGFYLGISFFFKTKKDRLFIISSPPYFSMLITCLFLRIRGMRYIVDVRDSYPHVLSTSGKISSNGVVFKILYFLNRIVFNGAYHIISATEGIDKLVHENSDNNQRTLILNGFKASSRKIDSSKHKKFSVCFHGVFGHLQDIENLLKLVESLEEEIDFYIVGYGPKERLIKDKEHLKNLFFLGHLSHVDTISEISKCHLGLSLRVEGVVSKDSFPVKVWEYIGLNMPCIVTPISEAGEFITKHRIGFQYNSDDLVGIKEKIIDMKSNQYQYSEIYSNLSNIGDSYSRENQAKKILEIIINSEN
tara:strand:+ start:13275 stop:14420 length:1146 start_codon:yes stop_codon:yes gene_type:complete